MASSLGKYVDAGLLVARLGFGLAFFWFHGYPKLMSGPDGWAQGSAAPQKLNRPPLPHQGRC